jgi:hypothetical protein
MSDYDTDSCTDSESERESVSDTIFSMDEDFLDADKDNLKYYIGLPGYLAKENRLLLLNTISPATFKKHNYHDLHSYLVEYSIHKITKPNVHIMQVHVDEHQAYNVILKTFWLKVVQRSWKRAFSERQQIINQQKNPHAVLSRMLGNSSPPNLPSIRGLLVKRQ